MIGYMKPQKHSFNSEDKEIYQSLYCGLCRNLRYEYGIKGALLINYEIVDILLLLEALQTSPPVTTKMSCSISPFLWKKMIGYDDVLFKLGSAISITIVALELHDNVIDDNRIKDKALLGMLSNAIKKVKQDYPDAWDSIGQCYEEYMRLEKKSQECNTGFYEVLYSCGSITQKIGELMGKCCAEEYSYSIGALMYFWGEWIYLLDAIDDYEKDIKSGAFNPLQLSDCPENIQWLLQEIEGNANDIINNLPVNRYQHIISELFGKHFPERRSLVCQMSKVKI